MGIPVKPALTLASRIGSLFSKAPQLKGFGKGPVSRLVSKPFRMGEEFVRGIKGTTADMPDYSEIGYGQGLWGDAGQHKLAQVVGGGLVSGAGYTLSRFMRGDKAQPQTDAHGTLLAGHDEEAVKNRQKFITGPMGGAHTFNKHLYNSMSEATPWVKTAIDAMGEDRYMQLRDAVAESPENAQKFHDMLVHSFSSAASPEEMKNVGKQPYVLPGLYTRDGRKRKVLVMNPNKNSKTGEQSFGLLEFDADTQQN